MLIQLRIDFGVHVLVRLIRPAIQKKNLKILRSPHSCNLIFRELYLSKFIRKQINYAIIVTAILTIPCYTHNTTLTTWPSSFSLLKANQISQKPYEYPRTEVSLNKKYLFTVIRVELFPQITSIIGAFF